MLSHVRLDFSNSPIKVALTTKPQLEHFVCRCGFRCLLYVICLTVVNMPFLAQFGHLKIYSMLSFTTFKVETEAIWRLFRRKELSYNVVGYSAIYYARSTYLVSRNNVNVNSDLI